MGEPGPEEATEQEARGAVSAHAMHNSSDRRVAPTREKNPPLEIIARRPLEIS